MGEGRREEPGKSRNFFLRLPFGVVGWHLVGTELFE